MNLPPRLDAVASMINTPYSHMWDCCCDHGYLGFRLLEQYPRSVIHFLDVVQPLVEQVALLLKASEIDSERWQTHCEDLKQLSIPFSEKTQLIIIAGVGGDLIVDMVASLLANNQGQKLDFILCPVRQLHKVRTRMNELGMGLVDEAIVKEGGRFYELIYLSTESEREISSVGEMWDLTCSEHRAYLNQNIEHYQRMNTAMPAQVHPVLQAYRALFSD